jgi:ribonuclease BN (tRNA processing enzyme)
MMKTWLAVIVAFLASLSWPQPPASHTQVVVLGTGTPLPDPERSGPAVAVVVNNVAYLVDCGAGVVRRAAAAYKAGISALDVPKLKIVFITHLHSDHTLGYPDLIFSPWVMERTEPLTAYGPRGLRAMTAHIEKAWQEDIRVRTQGLEKANRTGYRVLVHEIPRASSIAIPMSRSPPSPANTARGMPSATASTPPTAAL